MKTIASLAAILVVTISSLSPDKSVIDYSVQQTQWYDMKTAQRLAKGNQKKVLVFIYTPENPECHQMNTDVYSRDDVTSIINTFYYPVRIRLNSDEEITFNGRTVTEQALADTFYVASTPSYLFIDFQGELITQQSGVIDIPNFKKLLSFVGQDHYKKLEFDQYVQKN